MSVYKNRRKKIISALKEKHGSDRGVILLFAGFENHKTVFLQESSFYYLTGVNEPGVVLYIYFDGADERETLFVPEYGKSRDQWVTKGVSWDGEIKKMGEPTASYWMSPFFNESEYVHLLEDLKAFVGDGAPIFSLYDKMADFYFSSIYRLENCLSSLSVDRESVVDISSEVAMLRRKKDDHELQLIARAADITYRAHERVAEIIKPGMYEYEVQAEIERVFTSNKANVAFPSIVASGKNSTVLHYMARDRKLQEGDLLVVDIGAEVEHYCADLTRTYAVDGAFSPRQKEVHQIVLDTQSYVSSIAKPGLFLVNKGEPERSLHHLAVDFLKKAGYDQYFVHGIGHFLGLDVHDVGDYTLPLEEGDVITIEPGVYIPEENIGVRIEDDFVITASGCRVLCSQEG